MYTALGCVSCRSPYFCLPFFCLNSSCLTLLTRWRLSWRSFKSTICDLDAYITSKPMDGLFKMVAEEEKRIRENPTAQTSDLLQRVFGSSMRGRISVAEGRIELRVCLEGVLLCKSQVRHLRTEGKSRTSTRCTVR